MKRFFETTLTNQRIAAHNSQGEWTNQNLNEQLERWVNQRPDDVVIIDRFGQVTWAEFFEAVEAVSFGLLELGVRPGQVVQVQLPNWHHFVVAATAIEGIGAVINPVAPIFRHNEVSVMSDLARPNVVITASEFRGFGLAAMHAELRESCDWVEELVVVGEDVPPDALSWAELLEQGRFSAYDKIALGLLKPSANDVCEVIFTSGTTGVPKGVLHSPNTLNAAAELMVKVVGAGLESPWGEQAPDALVMHMASTLAHQTGFLYGNRMPLLTGGQVVLQDIWEPVEFLGLVDEHQVNMSMGATPFLADVVNSPELNNYSLASFKRFMCGGAAIPKPLLERAEQVMPDCTVATVWGMTECGALTLGRPEDPFEKRLTDGRALDGNAVRVVNEAGESVVGAVGDLQCAGSLLFLGYAQGRDLTNEHFTPPTQDEDRRWGSARRRGVTEASASTTPAPGSSAELPVSDTSETGSSTGTAGLVSETEASSAGAALATGWFHTGDQAIIDEDGYITIAGRTKDLIIRGGENIPVKEVEDVLIRHPAVENVAIVGKPDERMGEVGCAFVVVDPSADAPPTLSDLTDWLSEQQVTRQFWPEDLVIVSDFPMTPSGKVQKYRLRERL